MSECIKEECSAPTRGRTLDYAASIYDWLSPLMTFGHEKRMGQIALELLELKGHEKIIDIGCGTGSLTIEAGRKLSAEKGGSIVGVDAAAKMIMLARKKNVEIPQVRFDISAAEQLRYDDETFDFALSTFFFHHIDFELKKTVLNEMWRILKRGGKAVIVDIDTPTNIFGKICAWSGYILFRQEEIRENIKGKLREVMLSSKFGDFKFISSHLGYVSIFVLQKGF
ncbi:MAG: methyltransferase domain-containing protein [Planctomycetes bacterium]|nr:methyltransferase domain-containing protein [Planctomycetota bacterium]